MIVRAAFISFIGFLLIGSIGLLSALKDGSDISASLVDRTTGLTYSQRGFEALVFASARSVPHLRTRTSNNTIYDAELGRRVVVNSSVSLDFTAFEFCNYTGPLDAYFALAIIGVESFNRPKWRRWLDHTVYKLNGSDLQSSLSFGPMQMQVRNIHKLVSGVTGEQIADEVTYKVIERLEAVPCEAIDLVGRYLEPYSKDIKDVLTFDEYRRRLANVYRSGQPDRTDRNLYTDAILATHKYLKDQDRDRGFTRMTSQSFYSKKYRIGFWDMSQAQVRHISGDHCLGETEGSVLLIGGRKSVPRESLKAFSKNKGFAAGFEQTAELFPSAMQWDNERLVVELKANHREQLREKIYAERQGIQNSAQPRSPDLSKLPDLDAVTHITLCSKDGL
ncbi:hypothetical protein [Nereida sp. MMG025]|uniref:hypothetical protein n=1 Tax=Nereida sp. MMG025 TaxID=2909981 RepID=UPI001F38242E|nr:hypothetical protein [Nereida sp. MMG025]MCF6446113.1 hypothetical protein [Nereida sp. MMG025]